MQLILKIGTKIGSRAGLSIDEFQNVKKQFIECLKQHKFLGNDRWLFFLLYINDNIKKLKEIYKKEELIQGLEECSSQYQLVSAFPNIGQGSQVKRSNQILYLQLRTNNMNQGFLLKIEQRKSQIVFFHCIHKEMKILNHFSDRNYFTQLCFEHSYAAILEEITTI
ncbi:unnamed protein product [Paramecium sonneborni]|uniref:Uncharacterized protein n=1 Tax=Paramecium sonneborni TaxID=65129 RepID=A0A8S1PQC5_9CILI|nr:unnamed protein product [Paramecium sonneborni]